MIKLVHFIIIVVVLEGNLLLAQDYLKKQYEHAENLLTERKYFDAITEYKRLQFFDSLKQYIYTTNYKIGTCYKGGAKYSDAIKYFRLALRETKITDEIYNLKIEIIRCNILRKTTEQAFIELDQVEKLYINKGDEINYWRGWTAIFEDKWEDAAHYFGKIGIDHPLKKLADSVENEKYSILFPKLISYILPGVGQIYTGNYLSGLMSLGWNTLLVYLSLNSFYADRIFDGVITTALFFRFHRGNVQNAEKFAVEKNTEITNKALLYLQNTFTGLKP